MSEVQRLADEEAAKAEAESPDEATPIEPVEPDEPTEEEQEGDEVEGGSGEQPAPPAPDSQKVAEAASKKVLAANVAHAKRIGLIFGDEAGTLIPCPRCAHEELPYDGIMGFVLPLVAAPVPASVKGDVLLSIGEGVPDELEPDPYARTCDTCKGKGFTASGSELNREKSLPCIPCKARGWVAVGDERRVPQNNVTPPVAENGAESPVEQPPDVDPWGRTPSDPDYGRLPNFAGQR